MKLKRTTSESLKGSKLERKTRHLLKSKVLKQSNIALQLPLSSWFRRLSTILEEAASIARVNFV